MCHFVTIVLKSDELSTNLLNEFNAGCQVHAKVNELPHNALFLVLFLFQHKHVVVEELLQLLISVVDAQLLKGVELGRSFNERS